MAAVHARLCGLGLGFACIAVMVFMMARSASPRPVAGTQTRHHHRKPNFIVLFADDLGVNEIRLDNVPNGYTGNNHTIATPNLQRLANEGMVFHNWYSAFHVCSPSRASMMTGRYSIRSGIGSSPLKYAPDAPGGPLPSQVFSAEAVGGLPLNETTIAEALLPQGYATMAIGKWHLGQRDIYLPTARGFEEYYGIPFSQDMGMSFWLPFDYNGIAPMEPTPIPKLKGNAVVEQPAALDKLADEYAQVAKEFVMRNAQKDRPFFLYLPFNHVHTPNSCSPRFCSTSKSGPVGDAVQEMDWVIGEVMDALKHAGVDDNTLVLFTSDNGAPLANDEQGNLPLRDGKASTWEGGFKAPGIAWWPNRIPAGSQSKALVSTLDVFTTVITMAGGDVPTDRIIDGIDLSPILFNGSKQGHDCIMFYHNAAAVNASGELYAMRCGDHKIYWATQSTTTQPWPDGPQDPPLLFDLEADPAETKPIHPKSTEYGLIRLRLEEARLKHLSTISIVPDQMARGSKSEFAICAAPDSKATSPAWPNCTLTPENWQPAGVCNSTRCLQTNPHFRTRCGPRLCPGPRCPPVPQQNFVGCFHNHILGKCDLPIVITGTCSNVSKPLFGNMDVDVCNALCQGHNFFGVGDGGVGCYCGSTYGSQGAAPASNCSWPCVGNPLQTCGGKDLNSIYRVAPVDQPSTPWQHLESV
ncbi:hypothetical protein PTSG_04280 [Salpingoeca rosetta]|uniref:WSC domain-containing protein n=1 Tax=Salpingoeca rosetta (strain ATCC 50818 / BSB-021) TaxID=946362 RepID=F2U742_SALR5|nr:uncharacterized protein PTSG_04280 [Salpingoeca rosetta]EGD83674.1 hypothetical protein PTSG_04280 [Salpingoeca rosetta]|eukprot:XP_004995178.1 hypothetical protein PTSG_04280 [Salpingoeca rosetta]